MSACAAALAAMAIATTLVYGPAAADELDRTYKSVSGGRPYVRGPTSAVFEADGHRWTIVGADQPSDPPQQAPQRWSVETPYEVLRKDSAFLRPWSGWFGVGGVVVQ